MLSAKDRRWLDPPADWAAEFEADLNDLQRLIEMATRQPGPAASRQDPGQRCMIPVWAIGWHCDWSARTTCLSWRR